MLAELAAANAAFAVIKQAVSNGKEIAAAGSAIAEFVGAKEKLQSKAAKKGNGSDLEEFMALEQIREKEEELKQMMIILGRPGLWHDWQRFQAKARVARREAEIAAAKAAGMTTIGMGGADEVKIADHCFDSMDLITPEFIRSL